MNTHLVLLAAYTAGMVAFGVWIGRHVRGSGEFFVAGRHLSAPLILSTVLAANIGAGATVGAAGLAYRDGLSAWWWNGSAAIGSIFLALWIGPRIWRIAKDHDLYTAGDYLELRYGPSVRGIVAALIWLGTLSILAGQLIAGAAVLTVVAGIPRWAGTIVSALAMTIYFMAGGLLSSAWVNAVQLVVLLVGFVIALPIVVSNVGGMGAVLHPPGAPATFSQFLFSAGSGSGWTLLFLLGPAFIVSPGLLQKAYGAASDRAVRVGIGVQAIALAVFAFIPPIFGMAARASSAAVADQNLVLPTVLAEQLPVTLGALGLAAVFSAEVSTCDAILFMLATSLSQDLYKRFVHPAATDRQLLRVARIASVAGGVGGVVLSLWLPTVPTALAIFYSLLSVSLFVPVVGGLFLRSAGVPEALSAIGSGVVTLLVVRFALRPQYPWLDPTLTGIVAAAAAFGTVMMSRRRRL